ncbi:MAG: hypothetical protein NC217_02890 [Muribaculaceae bacterium]|nr:hypothetical protein [Muribaculaceae bacterium]
MMKEKLTELINTLYEAEGLVEMALRRKADTNDRLMCLIVNKCYELSGLGAAIEQQCNSECGPENIDIETPVYNEEQPRQDMITDDTIDDTENVELTEESVEPASLEEKAVEIFTSEILPNIPDKDDISDASIFDNSPQGELVSEEGTTPADEEPEYADEEEDEEDEEDYYEPEPIPLSSVSVEEKSEEKTEDSAKTTLADAPKDDKPIDSKPAEAPSRQKRPSLLSFCSINDKFRFKRELFSNSDHQMRHTFSLIEKMDSYDTVRLYCNSDLKWDPNQRVVKDFYAVIDRFFKEDK